MRAFASGSSAVPGVSTPMRRIFAGCCARAAIGHAATAPPIAPMKSRRLTQLSPSLGPDSMRGEAYTLIRRQQIHPGIGRDQAVGEQLRQIAHDPLADPRVGLAEMLEIAHGNFERGGDGIR